MPVGGGETAGGYKPFQPDGATASERGDEEGVEPEYEDYHVEKDGQGRYHLKGDDTGDRMRVMNEVGAQVMTGTYETLYGEIACQEAASMNIDNAMAVESIATSFLAANDYAAVTADMLGDVHENGKALRATTRASCA